MNKKILKRIEEIFAEKLQAKTGWGRITPNSGQLSIII